MEEMGVSTQGCHSIVPGSLETQVCGCVDKGVIEGVVRGCRCMERG